MCAPRPDLAAEFSQWSTAWDAASKGGQPAQATGAAAPTPAVVPGPAAPSAAANFNLSTGFPAAPSAVGGTAGAVANAPSFLALAAKPPAAAGLSVVAPPPAAAAPTAASTAASAPAAPSLDADTQSLLQGMILADPMHAQTLGGIVDDNRHIAQFPYGSRPFGYLLDPPSTPAPGQGGAAHANVSSPANTIRRKGSSRGVQGHTHALGRVGSAVGGGGAPQGRGGVSGAVVGGVGVQTPPSLKQPRRTAGGNRPAQAFSGGYGGDAECPPVLGGTPRVQTRLSLHGGVIGCLDRKLLALEISAEGSFTSWRGGGVSPDGAHVTNGYASSELGTPFTNEWDAWNDALVDLRSGPGRSEVPRPFRTAGVIAEAIKGTTQNGYLGRYAGEAVRSVGDDCGQSAKEVGEAEGRVQMVEAWEERGVEALEVSSSAQRL